MWTIREMAYDLTMCCSDIDTTAKRSTAKVLEVWRPETSGFELQAGKKKQEQEQSSEEEEEEEEEEEGSDDPGSPGSPGEGEASPGSPGSPGEEEDKVSFSSDGDKKELAQRTVTMMEFVPLLELEFDPEYEGADKDPDELFGTGKGKKKRRTVGTMSFKQGCELVRRMLEVMNTECQDVAMFSELAQTLGVDAKKLEDAIQVAAGALMVSTDEDGVASIEKTLAQKIIDELRESGKPMKSVDIATNLEEPERAILAAAEEAGDCLIIEKKKRGMLIKLPGGVTDTLERQDEEEHHDEAGREAAKRASEYRRIQVQRKVEDFLRTYTRGQNITKIATNGRRYHRRVYVDTGKKALVIQGAQGPKFYPFAHMKEIDLEAKMTKEGRPETRVIIALDRKGKIVKELTLAFADQYKGNSFVNCLSLFALALRQ